MAAKIILEISPIEMFERAKYLIEKEGCHFDEPMRIELKEVIYRGRYKVLKLKPIFDRHAPRTIKEERK